MEYTTNRPEYLDAAFDKFFIDLMEEWHVLGASLAVIDDKDIFAKGYGVIREGGPEVTEDTLFNAASMSKSFTASAIALLVQDNEKYPHVQWSTPASQLMREDFVLSDPYRTENVTITDMLSHRTGMPRHDDVPHSLDAEIPDTAKSITRKLRYLPFSKPFRTEFQYNNLMYNAASHLVECVTGKKFVDLLKNHFWDPLGMNRTYFGETRVPEILNKHPELDGHISLGYSWNDQTRSYKELPDFNCPEGQGAGNIVSSAKDWSKWIYAMIHESSVLSEESLKIMTKPIICSCDSDDERNLQPFQSVPFYGMGWEIEFYRGHKIVSHTGGVPGFSCVMIWLPERKWGIVMFGNSDGMFEVANSIGYTLIDEIIGVPKLERTDWAQVYRDRAKKDEAEDPEAEKELFPHRADPALPMSLPLKDYTGHYTHPAYGELLVEIQAEQLVAYARDRTFAYVLRWNHVSGDYFIVERKENYEQEKSGAKMEGKFEVGASGKVERIGVDFVDEDDCDYIWFTRGKASSAR